MKTNKNRSFRFQSKKGAILIILVILMLVYFCGITFTEKVKSADIQKLNDRWTFMVKGHSDQYIFGKTEQRLKNIQPNSALIMQQQLDMPLKDPQLVIRTNHQWVSVYIGEKLIYSYAPTKQQKDPGLLQSAIHLPSNYRKEKLRIVTKTPYDYYAGIPAQVFIGEAAEVDRYFILHSLPQLLLWITCSTLIVLMLILLFLKRKGPKKETVLTLILIGFTFFIGLQSIILNVPASTLFEPKTLSILYNLTAILIPVFLTSYYLLRTKKYQHYYFYGVGSQLFLLIFGVLCIIAGRLSLPVAVQIFSGFNVFMTLYTAAIALAESADQNRFYVICSPGIIMAAFIHCFFYIQLFAGAANLTTDWPLILFGGLMILISGYHFCEAIRFIRRYRIKQQEDKQQFIRVHEKQNNLLVTFKLLAEKEAYMNKEALSLTYFLQQMRDYYQNEFRKQAKFFSCQLIVDQENQLLKDENLYLLIQLFEKFLNDSNFGTIDISMKQENQQLIIESSTSAFTRHSFDESVEAIIPVSSHQELEQAVKRSNGDWHWQNKEKKQYFKITLGL